MNTRLKHTILLMIIVISIGCRSSSSDSGINHIQDELKIEEEKSNGEVKPTRIQEVEEPVEFDNSIIPGEVAYYVQTKLDSLRFPLQNDYDHYFFDGYGGNSVSNSLPYFCSGYYNQDSLLDYAVVLIKDTTYHYIFALNANSYSFDHYLIDSYELVSGENQQGWYVSFLIETETERVLEAIDTTYTIDYDGIDITNMNSSLEYLMVWNTRYYERLLFD